MNGTPAQSIVSLTFQVYALNRNKESEICEMDISNSGRHNQNQMDPKGEKKVCDSINFIAFKCGLITIIKILDFGR